MTSRKNGAPIDLALLDPDGTFPARLADDRAALDGFAGDLWALAAEAQDERLREIATLAHKLAGAAGTFGFAAISDAALALEEHILDRSPLENVSRRHVVVRQAIDVLVRALDDGLANAKR